MDAGTNDFLLDMFRTVFVEIAELLFRMGREVKSPVS